MPRYRVIVEAHLLLLREPPDSRHPSGRLLPPRHFRPECDLLMLRRFNTGFEDGNYSLVAGHVDAGETFSEAMAREAKEEAGLTIEAQDLELIHVMNRWSDDARTSLFFWPRRCLGEPVNCEPERCDELAWYPLQDRPKNTIPYIDQAIRLIESGEAYSEFGWPDPSARAAQ